VVSIRSAYRPYDSRMTAESPVDRPLAGLAPLDFIFLGDLGSLFEGVGLPRGDQPPALDRSRGCRPGVMFNRKGVCPHVHTISPSIDVVAAGHPAFTKNFYGALKEENYPAR
jgi:hypothetical protein